MAHEERRRVYAGVERIALAISLVCSAVLYSDAPAAAQGKCKEMRKVKLGVSVTPPNVVHTPVYVARGLGLFANRCIDAEIVEFEGGLSATNLVAVAQGGTIASMNATAIAQGMKAKQIWGMAPRLPQAYV